MSAANPVVQIERFSGGRRFVIGGGAAGLALLALTFVGMALNPQEGFFSYLVAFTYWCGIAVGALVLLMIMHTFKARWVVTIRRPIEVMASSLGIFLLLIVPVIAGMKHLYVWVDPPASLGKETLELLHKKHAYLNQAFFIVRSVVFLLLWVFLAERLFGWSKRQDADGNLDFTRKSRKLSPAFLPFMALTLSFAAFDWLMSLNPTWFSTIFGVYYFAGSFVAAIALWAVVCDIGRVKSLYGDYLTSDHIHNVGKLMLAFVCFWTYIGFSQLLLIWIAGLPEEVPFYIVRFKAEWAAIGIFLILGHFFMPFGALLSRSLKRDPRKLAVVGIWILLIHYVDIYWLVMPTLHPEGFTLHWTAVTAFFGIGLCASAFAVSRQRGQFALPIRDPYLADSLRYRQP